MRIFNPASFHEALSIKADHPDAVALAGGTDLMAQWSLNGFRPEKVLSLGSCKDMGGVHRSKSVLCLGACVTHGEIARHEAVVRPFPALAQAAASIGAPAIRNMGTIGGNLATASPAADLPPALMVHGAEVIAASKKGGERSIPMSRFFTGYRTTMLEPHDLLKEVRIPFPENGTRSFFRKVGSRKAQACAKISLALSVRMEGDTVREARIASGSAAPVPLRLEGVEAFLEGKSLTPELAREAGDRATREVMPIDDLRSTACYRRFVVGAMLADFLERLADTLP